MTLLLVAAAAAAQSENPFQGGQAGTVLVNTLEETSEAAQVNYTYVFRLTEPRSVFLKITPSGSNPAYDPDEDTGWTTGIILFGPSTEIDRGTTSSNDAVHFGELQANQDYRLQLEVYVPAGAAQSAQDVRLSYILAAEVPPGPGTGSQVQPSVDIRPVLKIEEPPPKPRAPDAPEEETNETTDDVVNQTEEPNTGNDTTDAEGPGDTGMVQQWLDKLRTGDVTALLATALAGLLVVGALMGLRGRRLRRQQERRLEQLEQKLQGRRSKGKK